MGRTGRVISVRSPGDIGLAVTLAATSPGQWNMVAFKWMTRRQRRRSLDAFARAGVDLVECAPADVQALTGTPGNSPRAVVVFASPIAMMMKLLGRQTIVCRRATNGRSLGGDV
jgi:hypothetical protein